jgi:hypothetical protein
MGFLETNIVNDTLYTIIDNRDNIYWFVDIKDIKIV